MPAKVGQAYIEFKANIAGFKKALDEAGVQTERFRRKVNAEVGEAKGSMALLGDEIGVKLPRHLRTFVAGLPGVATALSSAFSVVAVIGLGKVAYETGKHIIEYFQKVDEAAKKSAEQWSQLHESMEVNNAELTLANIKLENQIAKFEHKPENKLAEAIAESNAETVKLNKSLVDSIDHAKELLEQQKVGFLQAMWSGQGGPQYETTMLEQHRLHIGEAKTMQDKLNESVSFHNSLISRRNELDAIQYFKPTYTDASGRQQKVSEGLWGAHNLSPDVNAVRSMLIESSDEKDFIQASITNSTDRGTLAHLQGSRDQKAEADKAAEARLKTFEEDAERQKYLYGMDAAAEAAFWNSKLSNFREGSEAYRQAFSKFTSAMGQLHTTFQAEWRKLKPLESEPADKGDNSHGLEEMAAAQAKWRESWASGAAAEGEARDQFALTTGAISEHEFALHRAAEHAEEYRIKLMALHDELDRIKATDPLAGTAGADVGVQAKTLGVQTQIDQLQIKSRISQFEDTQKILGTSWKGMIDSVFDEIERRSKQSGQEMSHIGSEFIDGSNTQMAHMMTGGKTNWKGLFQSTSESLAKTTLQKGEGVLMKGLGFGKHDGSSESSALWVRMSGTSDLLSGSDISSLFGSKKPNIVGPNGESALSSSLMSQGAGGLIGMLNDSDWASGLFGGKLFGSGSLFGGHFAPGGNVAGGVPIEVGELGPEVFVPPSGGGSIVRHSEAYLGSSPTIHIDARGTDPALTRANVERGMQQTHMRAVADAQRLSAERSRRVPQ